MAAILVLFCFHANWPLWPRSKLHILLNFTFESEAITANLHGNKRILKWRPFWNKVYRHVDRVTVTTGISFSPICILNVIFEFHKIVPHPYDHCPRSQVGAFS